MTLHLFGAEGLTDAPEVVKAFEADYTAIPVVAQGLMKAMQRVPRLHMASRVLDPSAGSGGFGSVLRVLLDERAQIFGIEPRESEAAGLRARGFYNATCVAEFNAAEIFRTLVAGDGEPLELVTTNPPFTAFQGPDKEHPDRRPWWLELRDKGCLHEHGVVLLLGQTQVLQSRDAAPLLRQWSPRYQFRLGGRPGFRDREGFQLVEIPPEKRRPGGPTHKRKKNGTDSADYSWWLWDMDYGHDMREPEWTTLQLPVLPKAYRTWDRKSIPGTYAVEPALIAEIRVKYLVTAILRVADKLHRRLDEVERGATWTEAKERVG